MQPRSLYFLWILFLCFPSLNDTNTFVVNCLLCNEDYQSIVVPFQETLRPFLPTLLPLKIAPLLTYYLALTKLNHSPFENSPENLVTQFEEILRLIDGFYYYIAMYGIPLDDQILQSYFTPCLEAAFNSSSDEDTNAMPERSKTELMKNFLLPHPGLFFLYFLCNPTQASNKTVPLDLPSLYKFGILLKISIHPNDIPFIEIPHRYYIIFQMIFMKLDSDYNLTLLQDLFHFLEDQYHEHGDLKVLMDNPANCERIPYFLEGHNLDENSCKLSSLVFCILFSEFSVKFSRKTFSFGKAFLDDLKEKLPEDTIIAPSVHLKHVLDVLEKFICAGFKDSYSIHFKYFWDLFIATIFNQKRNDWKWFASSNYLKPLLTSFQEFLLNFPDLLVVPVIPIDSHPDSSLNPYCSLFRGVLEFLTITQQTSLTGKYQLLYSILWRKERLYNSKTSEPLQATLLFLQRLYDPLEMETTAKKTKEKASKGDKISNQSKAKIPPNVQMEMKYLEYWRKGHAFLNSKISTDKFTCSQEVSDFLDKFIDQFQVLAFLDIAESLFVAFAANNSVKGLQILSRWRGLVYKHYKS